MNERAEIYQIYYSNDSARMIDPGFIPLDNLTNERPDWREFWPIRNFFAQQAVEPSKFYGFLSPRFFQKTGLTSSDVSAIVASAPDDLHVVSLSPFSDHASIFWNVFEQAELHHKGFMKTCDQFAAAVGLNLQSHHIVNSTRDAIFCNYFLAKPAFWSRWLQIVEAAFLIAENQQNPLSSLLCASTAYDGKLVHVKVFLVERIASLLLAIEPQWKVASLPPFTLPDAVANSEEVRNTYKLLNSYKLYFQESGDLSYRKAFFDSRAQSGVPFAIEQ